MSLTVELALARCAPALGERLVYWSDRGVGSPLLSSVPAVERMALRPLGGVCLSPVIRYAPPVHLVRDHDVAGRILQGAVVIIDGDRDTVSTLRRNLSLFRDDAPEVIRMRGASGGELAGMACVLDVPESGDALWLRNDLAEGELAHLIADAQKDEFDDLSEIIRTVGEAMGFQRIRYSAGGAEVVVAPPVALDMPDARQLDAAFSEGRAVFDAIGSCALLIPHLSFTPAPFGFSVTGLEADAPDPSITSLPTSWRVETSRKGATWQVIVLPNTVSEATFFEVLLPPEFAGCAVEVSEVWTGIRRRRAAWDAWDEAEAQLDLEQSW